MTLRVAYMTGEYPRATDTFIQREVAALRERGVDVATFAIRRPSQGEITSPEQEAERGRTFYVLPCSPLRLVMAHLRLLCAAPWRYVRGAATALRLRPPGLRALARQAAYFAEAGAVAAQVREMRVVHLHNHFSNSSCTVALLAAEMGGFTFSFTMHGPAEFFAPQYWRVDEKIRRALFVCCISHFCRSQAMVFAPPAKWDRLHIVHCGVDPRAYAPVTHRGAGRRLLFVGRLAPVKGLPVLLQAVAELRASLPDLTVTVAGDGPDRAQLEAAARELGIAENVRFTGYQSQAQVRELLGETDVFVLPSFAEGVPVVLMEAMAAGVPVVATRIAGIPELVEDGVAGGFLVLPGDAASLGQKVASLLADPALRQRLGAAGREVVVRDFDVCAEAERLCLVLTEALGGRAVAIRPQPEKGRMRIPREPQSERPAAVGRVSASPWGSPAAKPGPG